MKRYLLTILAMLFLVCSLHSQHPSTDPGWTLVFEDEFNGSHINDSLWYVGFPWGQKLSDTAICVLCACNGACTTDSSCCNQISPEAYVITTDDTHNIKLNGGIMEMFVRKEPYMAKFVEYDSTGVNIDYDTVNYTTAVLHSWWKFKYGWFEIKFKLPEPPDPPKTFKPFGGNFWLYAASDSSIHDDPSGVCWSEIDVFEILNGQDNLSLSSIHWGGPNQCPGSDGESSPPMIVTPNVWHVFAADWRTDRVDFYFDSTKIYTSILHADSLVAMPLIVQIASPSSQLAYVDTTRGPIYSLDDPLVEYPYIYQVDYVKVWQRNKNCDTALVYCDFDSEPTPYSSNLSKSFTVGGDTCTSFFADISNFKNLSSDYILLKDNTTISTHAEVTLEVEKCNVKKYFKP